MLSKNTLKFIKSLHQKKFRKLENSFFVEGNKNVKELLQSNFEVSHLLYTDKFEDQNFELIRKFTGESYKVTQKILETTGALQTNDMVLAVARIKENEIPIIQPQELVIACDDLRDPGNLGTILRIADWYGVKHLLLSEESADFYNPKVLQSSMGSFTRVKVYYTHLATYFSKTSMPIYGTFLEGESIYKEDLPLSAIVLMGNESNGINDDLLPFIQHKITIPRFGQAESLNVAIATAVIMDNFRRNN
jgi:RNA methyltransferase, TrmH family